MKLEDICNKLNAEEKGELIKLLQGDSVSSPTYEVKVEFWDKEKTKIKYFSEYQSGKLHGKHILWYDNGNKCWEDEYQSGELHGKIVRWHESGAKMWEKELQNGKLHGKSMGWYGNGKKDWENEYQNGELINRS